MADDILDVGYDADGNDLDNSETSKADMSSRKLKTKKI